MKITISSSSKSLNQNNDTFSNYNNRDFNRSKYLNVPKQNKNFLCVAPSQSSRRASSINNNLSIIQKNVNIEEQLEQYKLHPYRRINLKILGEDIKNHLEKDKGRMENKNNIILTSSANAINEVENDNNLNNNLEILNKKNTKPLKYELNNNCVLI